MLTLCGGLYIATSDGNRGLLLHRLLLKKKKKKKGAKEGNERERNEKV